MSCKNPESKRKLNYPIQISPKTSDNSSEASSAAKDGHSVSECSTKLPANRKYVRRNDVTGSVLKADQVIWEKRELFRKKSKSLDEKEAEAEKENLQKHLSDSGLAHVTHMNKNHTKKSHVESNLFIKS